MSADGTVSLALFKFWLKESKSLWNSPTSGNRVEIIIHSIALFTASILSKHIQLQSEISSFHFGFFINACTLQLTNQMKYPHKIRINVSWEIFLFVIQTIHVRWFCGCTRCAMMWELLFWIWFTSFHSSFISSTSVHSSDIDFFMQTYGLKLTSFDSSRPVSHSLLSRRKNEIQHCFPGYFVNDAHNFQMNFFFSLLLYVRLRLYRKCVSFHSNENLNTECNLARWQGIWTNDFRFYFQQWIFAVTSQITTGTVYVPGSICICQFVYWMHIKIGKSQLIFCVDNQFFFSFFFYFFLDPHKKEKLKNKYTICFAFDKLFYWIYENILV